MTRSDPANLALAGGISQRQASARHRIGVPDLHLSRELRYRSHAMTEKSPPDSAAPDRKSEAEFQAERRAKRLADQLRTNLQRRKAQVRARREGRADEAEGLPAAAAGGAPDGTGDAD